ncbi:MAG: hypothetical protein E6J87_16300 [Deltaproteobacteria bacterium]|nr:MAG: hypothetical protein E6J87_16300 [Deltaproteobacteria bacterium]
MALAPPAVRPDPTRLTGLLRDLGSEVRRGGSPPEARADLATGIPALDALLGGGLARGRTSELHGPLSSGRTSLALALLARATGAGEVVAVIDAADAFHPASARDAGVQLERVLWVRPPGVSEAVHASERLLQARGFAVVLLDAAGRDQEWQALPAAVWQRLTRAAAAGGTALIVVSQRRVTGSHADLALALQPICVRFTGTPCLFEGLELEAAIARQRRGRPGRPVAVGLRAAPG